MKALKKAVVFVPIVALLAMPAMALAQDGITTDPTPSPVETPGQLEDFINRIVGFLQTLLYALVAVFIVIAGYKYLTAQGDPEEVETAKNMLLYALVALVLAVIAGGVANLIVSGVLIGG